MPAPWWLRSVFASIAVLLLSWGSLSESSAQSPSYEPVDAVQLFGYYVAGEKLIETVGYFWLRADGAFLNVNRPSARPAMEVDISKLSTASVQRLKAGCSSNNEFVGGCEVVIRAQTVGARTQQTLIAHEIEIRAKQN